MKKITLIAALAIAFVSCEKEEININSQQSLRLKSVSDDYTLITHKRSDYFIYHTSPILKLYANQSFSFGSNTGEYYKTPLNLSLEGLNDINYNILLDNGIDLILTESNDTLTFKK